MENGEGFGARPKTKILYFNSNILESDTLGLMMQLGMELTMKEGKKLSKIR